MDSGNSIVAEASMVTSWDAGLTSAQTKHIEPNLIDTNVLGSSLCKLRSQ